LKVLTVTNVIIDGSHLRAKHLRMYLYLHL